MTMIAGTVTVDDSGHETFSPNDATNCAKMYYLMLLDVNSTATMQAKTSGGPATWIPPKPTVSNPPTDQERAALAAWQAGNPVMVPPPPPTTTKVTHTIEATPQIKQQTAKMANGFAQIATFVTTNAVVTVTIPASAAGDGLQTSAAAGNPSTHPSSPKTISGSLT